ncbi:DUF2029 domain-containing protein [Granulicella sp. 5B5]|uniref:glycosyltransferase 87 family protein n=1 Tax=Granulicella sp. 5B5 TaxID=1617967 RepID=UPI0015F542C9|nr:glycosyltransferase 87 family protein [Granulicella sp. 5B5]QMV20009.1 DUF2029 domain-containing protein [Granulicella sp. 5B5]
MTTRENRPRVVWFERVVFCLSMLYLCFHTLPQAWRTLNTDFPNYYLASRLVEEHYDTTRMYEWTWIEREKAHRAIDIRVLGLLPITPFSTLVFLPLAKLAPLAAKHVWILLNLAILIPLVWMIREMTGLNLRWMGLALTLNFPLYRNFLFGQFYIVLLLLVVTACWCYLRGYRAWAGALLAIAGACKVFPILLFIFFLQRRDWRALGAGILTGSIAVASSIAVFGWTVHRTWLQEILPWVTRGEGLQPYTITASIPGILHRLFLSEPQWNPRPWHDSPFAYALLSPVLQTLILAPAILLIRRIKSGRETILLEWSALITAALTISTIPASYNFVLIVFPACVVASMLYRRRHWGWLTLLVLVYFGIGFPVTAPANVSGLAVLLYVPRLPLLLGLLAGIYWLLWTDGRAAERSRDWTAYVWTLALLILTTSTVRSTLRVERARRQEYAYRLPLGATGFLNAAPHREGMFIRYLAFTFEGYRCVTVNMHDGIKTISPASANDILSFADEGDHTLLEQALAPQSVIVDGEHPSDSVVVNGHDPMFAMDGKSLAFLRDDHGRGRLMMRDGLRDDSAETALTPARMNVYEAAYISPKSYVYAAADDGGYPQLYATDGTRTNAPLGLGPSRYPALSPDGRWLAYSHLEHGVWNLWIRDQTSGALRRVADVPCNQIQAAWENDSKTLLYSTDCGRSVWFTAVAQRKVLP